MIEWRTDWENAPKDGAQFIGLYWSRNDYGRRGKIVMCWWQPEFGEFISSCRQMMLAHGYTFDDGTASQLHSPTVERPSHWASFKAPEN